MELFHYLCKTPALSKCGRPLRFVTFFLLLLNSSGVGHASGCNEHLSELSHNTHTHRVPIKFFQDDSQDEAFQISSTPNYDPKAVYLGVANTQADGIHHYYLIVGNHRFETHGPFKRATLETGTRSEPPLASEGVVFKLQVKEETYDHIVANIRKRGRAFNSFYAVHRALKEAGIELSNKRNPASVAGATEKLLNNNLKSKDGIDIPIEVIATSQAHLEYFQYNAKLWDQAMHERLVTDLAIYSGSALGLGYLAVTFAQLLAALNN